MKRNRRNYRTYQWTAMVLACAMLITAVPDCLAQSAYAAAAEREEHSRQETWHEASARINASWGGNIAGEITLRNAGSTAAVGWQIEFPWDARITSMWNGSCEQDGDRYTIVPAAYNAQLEPGDSVNVGFLAEGEEEALSRIAEEGFFRESGVLVTTEEERQQPWYQEALGKEPAESAVPGEDIKPQPPQPPVPTGSEEPTESAVPSPAETEEPGETPCPAPALPLASAETAVPGETTGPLPAGTEEPLPTESTGTEESAVPEEPGETQVPEESPESTPVPLWTPEPPQPTETEEPAETTEPGETQVPEESPESTPAPLWTSEPPQPTETEESAVPSPAGTEEPLPSESAVPLPAETPEPAGDLYIYKDTTLTEDTVCGNLTIVAGILDCNGYDVTVQKDMRMAGGHCSLREGKLDIAGDATVENGMLDTGYGEASIGGSLRIGGTGSLWMDHGQARVAVKGDMEIASATESRYLSGTLAVGGNLARLEEAGEKSFYLWDSFNLALDGEEVQHVLDASPETSYYGNMDISGSGGVTFGQKVRGKNLAGLSRIRNRDKVQLEIDGLTLGCDEETTCGRVILSKGDCRLGGNTWKINGELQIGGETQETLLIEEGKLEVSGDTTVENGMLDTGYGKAGIGGSLRVREKGSVWMAHGQTEVAVKGDVEIASAAESRYLFGTLLVGGDLARLAEAGAKSFYLWDSFTLALNGEKGQRVLDASPETSRYGNMDISRSGGVTFGQKVRGKNLSGLNRIRNRDEVRLELDSLTLECDEETTCGRVILSKGDYRLGRNTWKINGDLQIGGEDKATLLIEEGKLEVSGDTTVENGMLDTGQGETKIGGNLRVREKGSVWMAHTWAKLTVKGDMEIDSAAESRYTYGTLTVGGDLTWQEDAAGKSFALGDYFELFLDGKKEQEVSLAYPEKSTPGRIDIRESAGVYFNQPVYGHYFYGLEKVANKDEFITYCGHSETCADGVLHCDLTNYGYVEVAYGTSFRIEGDVCQNADLDCHGNLTATGDYFIEEGSLYHGSDSAVKIKGDLWVGPDGGIKKNGYSGCLEVCGDFRTASRKADANYFHGGELRIHGNLTRTKTACVESIYMSGTKLVPCGEKKQEIRLNAEGEDIYLNSIDMTEAEGVFFKDGMLHTGNVRGWNKITNGYLVLQDSDILMQGDEAYHGSLAAIGSTWDCRGYKFRVGGSLGLADSEIRLFFGELEVGGDFTLEGASRLVMQCAGDTLRVHGDFGTESTESHRGLLSCGRFELYGEFQQSGHEESFATTALFTMAFCAEGLQSTHFASGTCYSFANVDPLYAGYWTKDSLDVAGKRLLGSVCAGFREALEELALSPDELVAAVGVAALDAYTGGILGKGMLALLLAATIKDLYDAGAEPINMYERAERYTKDITTLLATAVAEQYLEKAAETLITKLSDTKFVRGFTDFVLDADFAGGIADWVILARVYFAESDAEAFAKVSKYLDTDALAYLNAESGRQAGLKARDVAKTVLKCARKNDGTAISLNDVKFILRELRNGAEESVVVNLLRGKFYAVGEKVLQHSTAGAFTFDNKTGKISKMKSGGHSQANIDILEENNMQYHIVKTYGNGVRAGNVPDHKKRNKQTGTNQSWFPESWDSDKIQKAGEHVGNLPENKALPDGATGFGEYDGVRVGVIRTNGKIATVFPDSEMQP